MLEADRTFITGDAALRGPKGLVWAGRSDRNFRLSGGQVIQTAELEAAICAAVTGISDAVVATIDGESLSVLLVTAGSHPRSTLNHAAAATAVAAAMDGLKAVMDQRPSGLVIASGAEVARTGLGAIDRTAALNLLVQRRTAASAAPRAAA
jgi:long-subunit acyl-CoA synthetase (AMP-forming)